MERIDLSLKTALNAGRHIADAMNSSTRYVIISGALVTKTLADIMQITRTYRQAKVFAPRDATRIFIDHRDWLRFQKLGIAIQVADPIDILAVTVNPLRPNRLFFRAGALSWTAAGILNPIPMTCPRR